MSIQLAGFAGANVFKAQYAPRYTNGLVACGACSLAGAVIVLLWKGLYAWDDKRRSDIVVGEVSCTGIGREMMLTWQGPQTDCVDLQRTEFDLEAKL